MPREVRLDRKLISVATRISQSSPQPRCASTNHKYLSTPREIPVKAAGGVVVAEFVALIELLHLISCGENDAKASLAAKHVIVSLVGALQRKNFIH